VYGVPRNPRTERKRKIIGKSDGFRNFVLRTMLLTPLKILPALLQRIHHEAALNLRRKKRDCLVGSGF
jgi:hypothetical protein